MKKVVFSIFTMLFCAYSYAQELPNLIPPSPTAYELGKYGEVQVGDITGTIQPSIPLLTYQTQNIQLPISLSYNSNGIKVDQLESNVGLGWSLNIGGVISRTVRGKPDELRTVDVPQDFNANYTSIKAISFFEEFAVNYSTHDTSTDVFNYNFMGQSGKFVLGENGIPINLKPNGIKIENSTGGFVITDTMGSKYYFTASERSRSRNQGEGHSIWSDWATTAWYLTKIVHLKGDEMYFTYGSGNYAYDSGKTQSLRGAIFQENCQGVFTEPFTPSKILTTISEVSGSKLLKEITNNRTSDKIDISYKVNKDVNIANIISEIKLVKGNGIEVEKSTLNYLETANKRTFLTSVNFKDPDKKHELVYFSPNSFPKRLSFSQDHWGYYNGKNNTYFFPNPSTIKDIDAAFTGVSIGANKEVDPAFAKIGLLQQIIYPTKGSTSFEYESNSYNELVDVLPNKVFVNFRVKTGSNYNAEDREEKVLRNIKFDQDVQLFKGIRYRNRDSECANGPILPHQIVAHINVYNLTENTEGYLLKKERTGNVLIKGGIRITPTDNPAELYLRLKKNCDYRVSLSIPARCLDGNLNFSYYEGETVQTPQNILLGGLRIHSITNISEGKETSKRYYYYGKKESLNESSGEKGVFPTYVSYNTVRELCEDGNEQGGIKCLTKDIKYTQLNSSSIRNLYESASMFSTNYRYVTVSYGGSDFERGGEEKEFIIQKDGGGRIVYGDVIPSHPRDNSGFFNGFLKRSKTFKKEDSQFTIVKTVENSYKRDTRKSQEVYGYTVNKKFSLGCTYQRPSYKNLANLDVMETKYRTNWLYMDRSEQNLYDDNGENPITSTTNYFYDNDTHLQPTRTETTDSNGLVLKTKTYYPDDVTSVTSLGHDNLTTTEKAAIDQLKAQNRIAEPVQVESYKNNVLQSTQRTNYKNFGGLYLPEFVQTAKGTSGLEDRVVYHNYDNKGNPVEVSKKDGTKIYYVWGYHRTQPIAKIEGYGSITSAQQTAINNAITASNNDVSEVTENTLRTRLQTLRNSFTNEATQVTTFTYNPLVGVTSVTDPRGITMYYEYDVFNRLQLVKDSDKYIVKENQYHYKN